MFHLAESFNQDLSDWDISSTAITTNFCTGAISCGVFVPTVSPSSIPSVSPSLLAFLTKGELQDAVNDYCSNPEAWAPGYEKYDMYG